MTPQPTCEDCWLTTGFFPGSIQVELMLHIHCNFHISSQPRFKKETYKIEAHEAYAPKKRHN